ncbi:MAG: hypothetical protein GYA21_00930 [Myxococcales bacterium]|nr:hypothetical protein [Myxococcales bacterium]
MRRRAVFFVLLGSLWSQPAWSQWYDKPLPPPPEKLLVNPLSLNGMDIGSGGSLQAWLAPGTDPKQTELGLAVSGGYKFASAPVYLGVEVPFGMAQCCGDGAKSKFVFGNVGLGIHGRLDPDVPGVDVFTGWGLDVYLPTAWIPDNATDGPLVSMALSQLSGTSLQPQWFAPEALSVAMNFDVGLPFEYLYFQFSLRGISVFPVTDTEIRDAYGFLVWGMEIGGRIAKPLIVLAELKGISPFNIKDADGSPAPSQAQAALGVRLHLGAFKPALFVAFPLTKELRQAVPDAIIGLNLAAWF